MDLARRSLEDRPLARGELLSTLGTKIPLLLLLHEAWTVRRERFGNRVQVHVLNNAQNARCPEDCGYCSQSLVSTAPLEAYAWKPKAELVDEARKAYAAGARSEERL